MNSEMKYAIIIFQIIIIYLLLTKTEAFNNECVIPSQNLFRRNILYDANNCNKPALCPAEHDFVSPSLRGTAANGECFQGCVPSPLGDSKCVGRIPVNINGQLNCCLKKVDQFRPNNELFEKYDPSCVRPQNVKPGLNVIYELPMDGPCNNYALCPQMPVGQKQFKNLSPVDDTEIYNVPKNSPQYVKEYRGCFNNCISKTGNVCPSTQPFEGKTSTGRSFCCATKIPSPPTPFMQQQASQGVYDASQASQQIVNASQASQDTWQASQDVWTASQASQGVYDASQASQEIVNASQASQDTWQASQDVWTASQASQGVYDALQASQGAWTALQASQGVYDASQASQGVWTASQASQDNFQKNQAIVKNMAMNILYSTNFIPKTSYFPILKLFNEIKVIVLPVNTQVELLRQLISQLRNDGLRSRTSLSQASIINQRIQIIVSRL